MYPRVNATILPNQKAIFRTNKDGLSNLWPPHPVEPFLPACHVSEWSLTCGGPAVMHPVKAVHGRAVVPGQRWGWQRMDQSQDGSNVQVENHGANQVEDRPRKQSQRLI